MKYRNPIIPGYNPDPSICRVGDDYYIVNSSFEFFPGVPVYHSKNLVNWDLEGYCLTDTEQLYLKNARQSQGIYAPTIRYHNGEFFMTTTNVSHEGHLIVHTRDMKKGWSEPAWVAQDGIDPTLLFDGEDVYFASTSLDETGRQGIFLCKINPYTGEKLTESVCISYGCGGCCPEGPHLYQWFGKYYLLMAEGGTEYGHMVTVQRADSPYGPYEPCPHNPVLSHRYSTAGEIYCTGHGDIIQDHKGNWWMVCLGTRSSGEKGQDLRLHHLGRETFLAPVTWTEDGWPVAGNHGMLSLEMDGPLPGEHYEEICYDFHDDFSEERFSPQYNFLRNYEKENYIRNTEEKVLILKGTEVTLNDMASPTWLGIKQKDFETVTKTSVSLRNIRPGVRAGITAFYNDCYHYEIYVTEENGQRKVCLAKHIHDMFAVTASADIPAAESVKLKMTSERKHYYFYYCIDDGKAEEEYILLGSGSTAGLATEGTMMMTFTGTYIGLFAENGDGIFTGFDVKVLD